MAGSSPNLPLQQGAQVSAGTKKVGPWTWAFRILRWSTYLAALVTLVLALHKSPPPLVETSPQAAARAEEKFAAAEKAVANGQPATLQVDEAELNSYLASHLTLEGSTAAAASSQPGATGTPSQQAPTQEDIEQMKSNVRDVKVQLIDDRVKAYLVFNVHGKDLSLQLEGKLRAQDGYLRFEPISGQIGALPIPQSSLENAVQRLMDSPVNREKFKLPSEIADLRIENGEVVASYR